MADIQADIPADILAEIQADIPHTPQRSAVSQHLLAGNTFASVAHKRARKAVDVMADDVMSAVAFR